MKKHTLAICCLMTLLCLYFGMKASAAEQPNIVLIMTDDQGWGQTGYYDHPILETPNLDAMAEAGMRLDRFYAGAPNCSPSRATVLTGRANDRTGVLNHGYPLHPSEKTIAQALRSAGYATGHFGKWHLDGLRGPGAPILKDDPLSPGQFGFDHWISVTNFFDRNPLLSEMGEIKEFRGDSSEIIVREAIKFIRKQVKAEKPFFSVIWYGSPHSPFEASKKDKKPFQELTKEEQDHYGELVAMDRSVGNLRAALRKLDVAENTLVWFCSDNGGLQPFGPATVGGLRGWKNTMYEGGLRVPGIIEWPAKIEPGQANNYPTSTLDIFPTIVDIVGLPASSMLTPHDGISLKPLFKNDFDGRKQPIPFRHTDRAALVEYEFKLIQPDIKKQEFELYHLVEDPQESNNVLEQYPEVAKRLIKYLSKWNRSVDASYAGEDYKETPENVRREPLTWMEEPEYQSHWKKWQDRPEFQRYRDRLNRAKKK
ncbi:N-acetylgalactosamine 6-sulfate sulfatase [Planctomycetales bacterium 10988]|nr:N-acetylgalactosamine 6-sulfate sulfatase [Planctomycetales bacterium 10988]